MKQQKELFVDTKKQDTKKRQRLIERWLMRYKAKRKTYNITQKSISEATGYSLDKIKNIENGRVKITNEIMDNIDLAVENLNPEFALELLFDYCRIRFSETNHKNFIEGLLGIDLKYYKHENKSFYGYSDTYSFGNIQFYTSEREDMGVLLELKGKGCRELEGIFSAKNEDWHSFLNTCFFKGGIIKRIDFAIDDKRGILDVNNLIDKCNNGEVITLFRNVKGFFSGSLDDENKPKGSTLYLGTRKSEIHFCVYDKAYEKYVKYGINMEDSDVRTRFEIRLREERAAEAVMDFLEYNDLKSTIYGVINHYVRFIDPVYKDKRKCPNSAEWDIFLNHCENDLRLAQNPKVFSAEKTYKWVKSQVAPSLKMLLKLDEYNDTNIVNQYVKEAILNPQQLSILKLNSQSLTDITLEKYEK